MMLILFSFMFLISYVTNAVLFVLSIIRANEDPLLMLMRIVGIIIPPVGALFGAWAISIYIFIASYENIKAS